MINTYATTSSLKTFLYRIL